MAIYEAIYFTPYNVAIDATLTNTFSCTLQGTRIDKYRLYIYDNSDNSLDYDTGDVVISPAKYNNDQLEINIPANTLVNGKEYKWQVKTFEGINNVLSIPVLFKTNKTATISFTVPSTIENQAYDFIGTYTQDDGIPIEYYYFVFKDSDGDIILQQDRNYDQRLEYTFDGFNNNTNYTMQVFGATQNGMAVNSPIYSFSTSYPQPNVNIIPSITQDKKTSISTIAWGNLTQINGSVTGTYEYINDFMYTGNKALKLDSGSVLNYNINVPEMFTLKFVWDVPTELNSGIIVELDGIAKNYKFGYNTESSRFYFENGSIFGYSYIIPQYAIQNKSILVVIRPTDCILIIDNVLWYVALELPPSDANIYHTNSYQDLSTFTHTQLAAYIHSQLSAGNL